MFPLLRAFILEPALVILTHSRRKSSKLKGKKNREAVIHPRETIYSAKRINTWLTLNARVQD